MSVIDDIGVAIKEFVTREVIQTATGNGDRVDTYWATT
jgi:hypothetical protein